MQFGWPELLIVLILLVLLLGSDRLIKAGSELGKNLRSLQRVSATSMVTELVSETEAPLKVFVSSVMAELAEERKVVAQSIRAIPITRPWVFEQSPSSTDTAIKTYISQVKQADIFVLLIGNRLSSAVIEEYKTALDAKKPILVFIKLGEKEDSFKDFIKLLDVKWSEFSSTEELSILVQSSIGTELIKGYRRYRLSATELSALIVFSSDIVKSHPTLHDKNANQVIGRWKIKISHYFGRVEIDKMSSYKITRFDVMVLDLKENGQISGTRKAYGAKDKTRNIWGKVVRSGNATLHPKEGDADYYVNGSWFREGNILHMKYEKFYSGDYASFVGAGIIIGAGPASAGNSYFLEGMKI
jgi:Sec-independent protein translocase protein TatA